MFARKKWIIIFIIAVLAGGSYYRFVYQKEQAAKKNTLKYESAAVERGDIVAKVTASGVLSALVTVTVGSQVSGRIKDIYVDYNSKVKKGQKIAKIDPELLETAQAQARANHQAALADLAKSKVMAEDAHRIYRRTKQLSDQGLIARSDADTAFANANAADASILSARAKVGQMEALLRQASVNLNYTDILSPTNGVVISRSIDVGQTVAASLQAPVLFTIAEDLAKMQVNTSVAEADIGRISPGMKATFSVDAYPAVKFLGKVRQIRNSATTVSNVVTYDAVIDVDNPELLLKPGMTANVTFIFAEERNVLKVPKTALRFKPSAEVMAAMKGESDAAAKTGKAGGQHRKAADSGEKPDDGRVSVWVLEGERARKVFFLPGTSDGSFVAMAQGKLTEGMLLVTDASAGDGKGKSSGGMRRMF